MTTPLDKAGLEAALREVADWLLKSRLVGHELTAVRAAETVKHAIDALSALPAAGREGSEGLSDDILVLVWELLQTIHQPAQKAGSDYWHVTAGKHAEFGKIISALHTALASAPPAPRAEPVAWHDLDTIAAHVPAIKAGYAEATGGCDFQFIAAEIAKFLAHPVPPVRARVSDEMVERAMLAKTPGGMSVADWICAKVIGASNEVKRQHIPSVIRAILKAALEADHD